MILPGRQRLTGRWRHPRSLGSVVAPWYASAASSGRAAQCGLGEIGMVLDVVMEPRVTYT
jgi:hypothetical protein